MNTSSANVCQFKGKTNSFLVVLKPMLISFLCWDAGARCSADIHALKLPQPYSYIGSKRIVQLLIHDTFDYHTAWQDRAGHKEPLLRPSHGL